MKASEIKPGMRFGRLTVVAYSGRKLVSKPSYSGRPTFRHTWMCLCDCGVSRDFIGHNLTHRRVQSCGCLKNEMSQNRTTANTLIGKKFNHLTVVDFRFRKDANPKHRGIELLCVCDCGNVRWLPSGGVTHGSYLACGCKRGINGKKPIGSETTFGGERFRKLTKEDIEKIGRKPKSVAKDGSGWMEIKFITASQKEGRPLSDGEWLRSNGIVASKFDHDMCQCDRCGKVMVRVRSQLPSPGESCFCRNCFSGRCTERTTDLDDIAIMRISGASEDAVCLRFKCSKPTIKKAVKKWLSKQNQPA